MSDVSRETKAALEHFVALLLKENSKQNLIAASTVEDVWSRHIADALQLIPIAPKAESWVDIGSGPGLPGMVIAISTGLPTTLVEPRPLRTSFLSRVASEMDLDNVTVFTGKASHLSGRYDAITARAVAKASELLRMTLHLSHVGTRWVLPKGRSVRLELEALKSSWQGSFRVEPSQTDPEAGILIAEQVRPRGKR